MSTLIVVDVGNSRLKWGRCDARQVVEAASLPLDVPAAWDEQAGKWRPHAPFHWAVAGVNPCSVQDILRWIDGRGEPASALNDYRKLPVTVAVESPERVGLDRLLNAVAAKTRLQENQSAVLIDAGSAVTVDWLDVAGVFRGGAIFPGLNLMARALNTYTAKLPLVEATPSVPAMPGTNTEKAIAAGIHAAVVGGIKELLARLPPLSPLGGEGSGVRGFLTGGDAALLASALPAELELWPFMTLEGIRLTVAGTP